MRKDGRYVIEKLNYRQKSLLRERIASLARETREGSIQKRPRAAARNQLDLRKGGDEIEGKRIVGAGRSSERPENRLKTAAS